MTNYATTATTYTRTVIDNKFTDIIAGAPNALNTLKELSDALGADANYSATVLHKLGEKQTQQASQKQELDWQTWTTQPIY